MGKRNSEILVKLLNKVFSTVKERTQAEENKHLRTFTLKVESSHSCVYLSIAITSQISSTMSETCVTGLFT